MHFFEWFNSLKKFLEKNQNLLTEQVNFKLSEIVQFADQFSSIESNTIPFVPQKEAQSNCNKTKILN